MVSLTAKQQETLDLLKSKKYDEIKQAMVTRLINRIQTDERKIGEIMPIVKPYLEERGISPKKILSKLKDPEDMEVYFSTMKKEKKRMNNIDTSKPLLDVLDEINDTVPDDTVVDNEKRKMKEELIPKKRADDSQMAKKRLGEDGKGRPPLPISKQRADDSQMARSRLGEDGKGRPPTNIGEIKNTIPENTIVDNEQRLKEGKEYAKGFNLNKKMKRTSKLKALASPQYEDDGFDNGVYVGPGQYAESQYDQLIPDTKGGKTQPTMPGGKTQPPMPGGKTQPPMPGETKERFPGKAQTLGDITKLTEADKKKQKPVDKQSWINRLHPTRDISKEPLTKEEEKSYSNYFDAAKAAFYSFREEYNKLQEEIAETNKLIEEGKISMGLQLNDQNDPLGMMRSLGYTTTGQFDSPGGVGRFYHHVGEVAGNAVQAFLGGDNDFAKYVGDGIKFLGDAMGSFGDWAMELKRRRDYEWGRNTLEEIKAHDEQEEGVIGIGSGTRGDPFYQPNWKYTDYLPVEYDQYGNKMFNGFLQGMYLKPLERYAGLLDYGEPEFIDSMTPEQKEFLRQLKATTIKIRMNNINLTHEQYKKLIGVMVNSFTPEQRNAYLKTQEEQLLKDVNDVYNYGKDDTPGKIAGGAVPFKDYIINSIKKEITRGGKTAVDIDDDDPDPSRTETEEEKKEEEKTEEEKKREKDDDKEPDKPDKPEDEPEPEPEPDTPDEPKPADFRTFDTTKPTYRPRGTWGGTDEIFKITPAEAQARNLVWESMTLNSGDDRTSQTWKWNQHKYKQRYSKTFKMPRVPRPPSRKVSGKYIAQNKPVWNPQYADNRRQFFQDTRDPYAYGQFNEWVPRDNVVNPVSMDARMEQPIYYPEYQNKATQGGYVVRPQLSSGDLAKQMMMNSRFVRN